MRLEEFGEGARIQIDKFIMKVIHISAALLSDTLKLDVIMPQVRNVVVRVEVMCGAAKGYGVRFVVYQTTCV
jgi:hypothetical protein